jgi:hypothetical protein
MVTLACSLPGLSKNDNDSSNEVMEQPDQQQPQPEGEQPQMEVHAPTQALPRPTRPEGESQLPKPPIPAPPTLATRQPAEPPEGQEQPPQQEQQPGSEGETGTFYIVNSTSQLTICYFYMTFSTDPEWGPDRLGSDDIIDPGETYTITGVPYGTFDAQALDCDGYVLGEVYGFDFPPNDTFTLYD